MSDESGERTEPATPERLRKAREQGNVARSVDLPSMVIIATLAAFVYSMGEGMLRQLAVFQVKLLAELRAGDWSMAYGADLVAHLLLQGLAILAPLMMALVVAAVAVNVAQTGPVFSLKSFEPDPNRLNPVQGLQRLFSLKGLFDTAKGGLKLLVLLTMMYAWTMDTIPGLLEIARGDPRGYLYLILHLCGELLVKLAVVLLILAVADLAFVRWQYARDMRMSKHDVKQEYKQREGDPRIRIRIRQLQREMLKRSQSMGKVKNADVLITNPTHIAIAISYEHGVSPAPLVLAKGSGELAKKMREVAGQYQIPVVQNVTLARALYREVEADSYVPENWFPQVAKILIWVYSLRRQTARPQEE